MRFETFFLRSGMVMLVGTAVAKLFSATGDAPVQFLPDPLLGLANRHVLIGVASVELAVAAVLGSPVAARLKYLLTAWLAANFLLYRVAFYWMNPGKVCPCLGNLTQRLGLNPNQVSWVLWGVVIYLLAGSVWSLRRLPSPSASSSSS